MIKKEYEKPIVEIIELKPSDMLMDSGDIEIGDGDGSLGVEEW